MIINKKAVIVDNYLRKAMFYKNARAGFQTFLRAVIKGKTGKVLLPAYIGWSSKEGSGVFDPVTEIGMDYVFYKMTDQLYIDAEDVKRCFKKNKIIVAVIIHYFGYVDPAYEDFVSAAHSAGAVVLEDEAHSMLSDIAGGVCGRLGDASIYSLHKLLPVDKGGVLLLNSGNKALASDIQCEAGDIFPYWEYDLFTIAQKRRENAVALAQMMQKIPDDVDILRPVMNDGIVPQTLPIIIKNVSRDRLYEVMNLRGYGVVSLYHTMIEQITKERFPDSHKLSRKIMNLPVHQDLGNEELRGLADCLKISLAGLKD
ncbi:MAG: DegT/DnrJ/EryC1/StrS family aminotransferase [Candidatus Omnitrophica bacterium]|nr:DegT/DnrJ/EryC1/StrS family aminotransferase [Candidatus Omnitrophota bacterium]